jgi:hypothetical protein
MADDALGQVAFAIAQLQLSALIEPESLESMLRLFRGQGQREGISTF